MVGEARAGQLQQLWSGLQVDLGAEHILVAQISREPRQTRVNILTSERPRGQPVHSKGVPKLVGASANSPAQWLDAKFSQALRRLLRQADFTVSGLARRRKKKAGGSLPQSSTNRWRALR